MVNCFNKIAHLLKQLKITEKYSQKNIPIPNITEYEKQLVEKVDNFIRRLNWKAFWSEDNLNNDINNNTNISDEVINYS